MNDGKVKIAAGLIPLMRWLYDSGIICVGGSMDTVHVTEEFFRETFPVYEVSERNNPEYPYELSYNYNGVQFFALSSYV